MKEMTRAAAIKQALINFEKEYKQDIMAIYVTNHRDYYDILIKSSYINLGAKKISEHNFVVWKNFEKVEEYND